MRGPREERGNGMGRSERDRVEGRLNGGCLVCFVCRRAVGWVIQFQWPFSGLFGARGGWMEIATTDGQLEMLVPRFIEKRPGASD